MSILFRLPPIFFSFLPLLLRLDALCFFLGLFLLAQFFAFRVFAFLSQGSYLRFKFLVRLVASSFLVSSSFIAHVLSSDIPK